MDIKHNEVVHKFIPHAKEISSVQLLPSQGVMITSSLDYTAKVWRVWVPDEWKGILITWIKLYAHFITSNKSLFIFILINNKILSSVIYIFALKYFTSFQCISNLKAKNKVKNMINQSNKWS